MKNDNVEYDYLIVGAGLFGATFAQRANENGKRVLVIDKRDHIGGNAYTERIEGINVHKYGAHIFHTSDDRVYEYLSRFTSFNDYIHMPMADYNGELYNLPFNMYTFNKMWGVETPEQAKAIIDSQRKKITSEPQNLEEQAIRLVGRDIYEKLIKGYTTKQWGRPCNELPAFIIKRIPVRFTYDNRYFDAVYQGIPVGGYTQMIEKMLEDIEIHLNEPYEKNKYKTGKTVFTGPIDEYFDYCLGHLEYRSVRFENEILEGTFQENAVVNYTDTITPWTRIIEHKWFESNSGVSDKKTVISREYSEEWNYGCEPFYPINDEKNMLLYNEYLKLAEHEENVVFGGRLGTYRYYDMDQVVAQALELADIEIGGVNGVSGDGSR